MTWITIFLLLCSNKNVITLTALKNDTRNNLNPRSNDLLVPLKETHDSVSTENTERSAQSKND